MNKAIGENIRKYRTQLGLTIQQLSELSGISRNTIQRYETSVRYPNVEALQKIAKALNTDILLLTGSNEILKELGLNPQKIYAKDTNGAVETFIEMPMKKTIPEDKALSYIREYIKFIAEQNNICMTGNEVDNSLPSIKEFVDTFIKHKLLEDHSKNRGTQIK